MSFSERPPVPPLIAFRSSLIPEGLTEEQYKQELKKIIRECMIPPHPELYEPVGFDEYDERVWLLIEEVLREN